MTTRLTNRKLFEFGFTDVLSYGWRWYTTLFSQILFIVLCVSIPVHLILAWGAAQAGGGLAWWARLVDAPLSLIAIAAVAFLVEQSLQKKDITWQAALEHGLYRWPKALLTGGIFLLIVLGLSLLFIIPGVIWGTFYTFWIYVVAVTDLKGKAALDYSKQLVQERWWRVFLITWGLNLLVGLAIYAVQFFTLLAATSPLVVFVMELFADVAGAWPIVMLTIWFLDLDYVARAEAHLLAQIQATRQAQATQGLLKIWMKNDRQTWRPEAFQTIQGILIDRLGSVPKQPSPAVQMPSQPELPPQPELPAQPEPRVVDDERQIEVASGHLDQAEKYMAEHDVEATLMQCEAAVAAAPHWAEARYYRGTALEELGRLEEAIADYEAALRFDAEYADVRESLSRAKQKVAEGSEEGEKRIAQIQSTQQYEQTESLLEIWMENDRETWTSEALEATRRILVDRLGSVPDQSPPAVQKPSPLQPPPWLELSPQLEPLIVDDERQIDEASGHLDQADKFVEEYESEATLAECQAAVEAAPHWAEARYYRGMALEELGRLEEAIADYEAAIRFDPEYSEVREAVSRAKHKLAEQMPWIAMAESLKLSKG